MNDPGSTLGAYGAFGLWLLAILAFVAVTLWLNAVLGPKPVASAAKLEAFECGATPVDAVNVKAIPAKYHALAVIFILFDLETVFLFLWAVGARPLDGAMVATFLVFTALLVLMLLHVLRWRLLDEVTR